jgi:addiction module HigA family antidote
MQPIQPDTYEIFEYHQEAIAMRKIPYSTPGEILSEEFLQPLEISAFRLAKDIGVPRIHIVEIVAGKLAITVDTGLRLSAYFGVNDDFWTGLQSDYEAARFTNGHHPWR